jgi:hypothetical protein
MPSPSPIPRLGLTLDDVVDLLSTGPPLGWGRVAPPDFQRLLVGHLRGPAPLLSLKVRHLGREEVDQVFRYLREAQLPNRHALR